MNQVFSKIGIVVIVIVLLAGGILAWQYFWVPEEEVKDETTNWKVYRNEKLEYEIKYPPTWSIAGAREDFGIEISRINFQSENYRVEESEEYKEIVARGEETGLLQPMVMVEGLLFEVVITEIPSDPMWCIGLIESISQKCSWRDWAERATDYPYGEVIGERTLQLRGKEIYERWTENGEIVSILISFPDPKETKLVELILHTLKKDREKNLTILNQMIATSMFLK